LVTQSVDRFSRSSKKPNEPQDKPAGLVTQ
jgi:hypothetical protein